MDHLIEVIGKLSDAADLLALRRETVAFFRSRGFGAAFFITPISRNGREGRVLANLGFDELWARAYRWYLHRVDPLPEIALMQTAPFRWLEAPKLLDLTSDQQRYMDILKRRGMGDGLAIPTYGPGGRSGLVGLGLNPELDKLTSDDIVELQVVLQAAYQRYCDIVAPDFMEDSALSQREMDVLHWLTRGKSNSSIATILAISPTTVDTYVRRIYRKFGVTDRVSAAMAAVQHGYAIPGSYPATLTDDQ